MNTALGDVCRFLNGGTPSKSTPRYFEGDIPWITGADITGPLVTSARSFVTEEAIASSATNRVPAGTILLVTRTSVGRVAVAGTEVCFSQDITAITPDSSRLDVGYLKHFLSTQESYFSRRSRGATIKGITREVVERLEILLAPLPEQRRIAAILDQAEELCAKRRIAVAKLNSLTPSLFIDQFGDPVANPKGERILNLSDVALRITDGVHKKPDYTESGVPFISVKNITTGELKFDNCKFVSRADHENFTRRCKAERGDVLYTKVGATYGRPALVDTDREFSLYVSVCLLKPNRQLVEPRFLCAALGTEMVKQQADRKIKGIGVPDLHLDQIRSFLIPVPSLEAQKAFADQVAAIDRLKASYRASLAKLDALFASLQHRAFRGEL